MRLRFTIRDLLWVANIKLAHDDLCAALVGIGAEYDDQEMSASVRQDRL
jgi:hypothetical protein